MSLRKETTALQECIDSLSGKTSSAQKLQLERAKRNATISDSVKPVIEEAIKQAEDSIIHLDMATIQQASLYNNRYSKHVEFLKENSKAVRNDITLYLHTFNIELTSYRFSIPSGEDIRIDSPEDCTKKIEEVNDPKNRVPERAKGLTERVRQSQAAIHSTRFYRETIFPGLHAKHRDSYHQELKNATDSLDFFKEKPSKKLLLDKVEGQVGHLSKSLNELQNKAEEDAHWYPDGTLPKEGLYSQAISQYKALLDLHEATMETIKPQAKQAKQAKQDKASQPPDFITVRNSAIATLWQPKKSVTAAYREFLGQYAGNANYNPVNDIYRKVLALHKVNEGSHKVLKELEGEKREREKTQTDAKQCTDTEMQDFHNKVQAYLNTGMSIVIYATHNLKKVRAIIDYCFPPAWQPLQDQIPKNQADIASITDELVQHTHANITDQEYQKAALESKFRELTGREVSDRSTITRQQIVQQQKELLQQQSDLQKEVSELTDQLDRLRQKQERKELQMLLQLKTSKISDTDSRQFDSKITIPTQPKKVREYTDLLSRKYKSEYRQEVDMKLAVDSASFLSKLEVVGKKLERYLAAAAHILHEFGVSLNSLYLDSKTYEIQIEQHGDKKAGKQTKLEPLRVNRYGVLLVGNKKFKVSVLATKEETHTLILSIRAGDLDFAPDTPMIQSGTVELADLMLLTAKGSRKIAELAAAREFREEATSPVASYELVPNTLERKRIRTTIKDHVVCFRALAREAPSSARIDTAIPEVQEVTDVFLLDVPEVIQKKQLDVYNFSAREDRFSVMQSMLDEASDQNLIAPFSGYQDKRWSDVSTSYNVSEAVDYIAEIVKTLSIYPLDSLHLASRKC